MTLPSALDEVIEVLQRLPGVGPKSAARMAFYLLNTSQDFNKVLSRSVGELKEKIKICKECFSVSDSEVCSICNDETRDKKQICVVERALDVISLESVGEYRGVYHVLGGVINPLEHSGPEDLKIEELIERIKNNGVDEVILAMNLTMEGEATALYIKRKIKDLNIGEIKITRIGSGLPMGADLGYADQATLNRAMEGRTTI